MGSCCYDLTVLSLLLSLCVVLPSASSVSFNLSGFEPDMPDILFEGDAKPSNGVIDFNEIKFPSRVGRVTYAHDVRLWNSETRDSLTSQPTSPSSLTPSVKKRITVQGFAFFLAPAGFQIPQNSNGGFLGLFNTTTINSGDQNQMVLVEFDSFPEADLFDPPNPHVGIDVNSLALSTQPIGMLACIVGILPTYGLCTMLPLRILGSLGATQKPQML
ncbi:L-type lectin-domain containing receptor kinase IX.1 [Morella rubra]|uniref:L-type lectin-domain containing receptor kinase IX.1 n=1 Tax=Morella rubra TaxID=262757 RepID=A0A6A1UKM1_9ROSI|nr:L-type lectin-domain containing receptor kinase IX.1 [Morella rubra]